MNVPVRYYSGPVEVTDSSRTDDLARLAQMPAARGGLTLIYAPSTTAIHHAAQHPDVGSAPIEPPMPTCVSTETAPLRPSYTLGDVIAYCGTTLMGGATLSELVMALLHVPLFVPVLGGAVSAVGMVAAIFGATLDSNERTKSRQ